MLSFYLEFNVLKTKLKSNPKGKTMTILERVVRVLKVLERISDLELEEIKVKTSSADSKVVKANFKIKEENLMISLPKDCLFLDLSQLEEFWKTNLDYFGLKKILNTQDEILFSFFRKAFPNKLKDLEFNLEEENNLKLQIEELREEILKKTRRVTNVLAFLTKTEISNVNLHSINPFAVSFVVSSRKLNFVYKSLIRFPEYFLNEEVTDSEIELYFKDLISKSGSDVFHYFCNENSIYSEEEILKDYYKI